MSLVTLREDQSGRGFYLTTIEVNAQGDVLVSRKRETGNAKPQVTRYPAASLNGTAPEFVQQLQAKFLAQGMTVVEAQNNVPSQIISLTVVPSSPRWELVEQYLTMLGDLPPTLTPSSVLESRRLHTMEFAVTPQGKSDLKLVFQIIASPSDRPRWDTVMRHAIVAVLLDAGTSITIDDEQEHVQTWLGKQSSTMDDAICDFLANAGLIRRPIRIEQVASAYAIGF